MTQKRSGFTLVELLVTIGILVVLLALLLPAVRGAREQAENVRCQNNVRTITHAMLSYALDNEAALPSAPSNTTDVWPRARSDKAYLFTATNALTIEFDHGAIMKYLGPRSLRPRIMLCTAAIATTRSNYSYVLNDELTNTNSAGQFQPQRLFQIPRPAQKILIFEADAPDDGHFNLNGSTDQPSINHFRRGNKGSANYGFADEHVESLTRAFVKAHINWATPLFQ